MLQQIQHSMKLIHILFFIALFTSCTYKKDYNQNLEKDLVITSGNEQTRQRIFPDGKTIATLMMPPQGYVRIPVQENSFAAYLRQLPLKPNNALVKLYNGEAKPNNQVYDAVVDLEIGKKNLHQCADAIMRLRASYHWENQQYEKIHFNFTNGFRVDYTEWIKGNRMVVKGNKSYWTSAKSPSNTYSDFWEYMELIFTYAGTLSLSKELDKVDISNMKIGDIFIQGGSPGHAVIVVDMCMESKTGKKLFLLAQSYMPAQEIHILKNPKNSNISPWYEVKSGQDLITPEWTFLPHDLKRFRDN